MVIGMDRRFAPQWRTGELAAAIGNYLIDVHIKLSSTPGHPHMQREHIVMLTGQDFIARFDDQLVALIIEAFAVVVRNGSGFLQGCVGSDHLPRN